MSTVKAVQEAKSPVEAMLALAVSLDLLHEKVSNLEAPTATDGWGDWSSEAGTVEQDLAVEVDENGDSTVSLPVVDEAVQNDRRIFARNTLKLAEVYNEGEQYIESYAKGGPLVLYLSDRDFVMGLPESVKREMIEDVAKYNPSETHSMARDLLKDTDATVTGSAQAWESKQHTEGLPGLDDV